MPHCTILYHYYYPDDVVSSRLFTDFAEGLVAQEWDVSVLTSNRYCWKEGSITPLHEMHNGVVITRFRHPPFSQTSNVGRLINSICLSFMWFFALLKIKTDVVIFGTDPQFCFFMIPVLAFFKPKLCIGLWGFDLYPEALIADGIKLPKAIIRLLKWWAGLSYRSCGLLVDIGYCMRKRFLEYNAKAIHDTIVPWAMAEPVKIESPDNDLRRELFGDAALGLLYSGTIGRAHQFEEFILLARELRKRNASISFCFAGQGNRYKDLQNMIKPDDSNIRFAGFIDEKSLPLRLAAADIHMISLRQGWEGIVVPSKFFGSLASGRPLLYCGAPHSCIAEMIIKEQFGFIVEIGTIQTIADKLEEFSNDSSRLINMQKIAFAYYKNHFSRNIQCAKWDKILREYIKTCKVL
jgi:glycosyltransferase involved in cell wall biosynthesis